ncbi:MAG TPA: MFS transporter [Methanocorpusculum sp.]|nr:MFS transporter [Methanocorpusculum sp.]
MTAMVDIAETKKTAAVIVVAVLLYGVVAGIRATTGVFTTEIANVTGLTYGAVSGIFAVRNLVFGLSTPFIGLLTQKIPMKYIMAGGAALVAIGLIGAACTLTYVPMFIFLGIFLGLGAGTLCYSMVYAAVSPFLGKKNGAICAGILGASQGAFNIIIAPFIGIFGSTAPGLIICLVVLGSIVASLVPISIFFWKGKEREGRYSELSAVKLSNSFLAPLKYMAKRPYFLLLVAVEIAYGLCDGLMVNHLYERTQIMFSVSPDSAGYLVVAYGISIMIGPIIGGLVAAGIKNLRLGIVGVFGIWLGASLLFSILPWNQFLGALLVIIMGLSIGMVTPIIALLTQEKSPAALFGAIFPFIGTFVYLSYSFDSYLGGLWFDQFGNFNISVLITHLVCVLVIVLFLIVALKERKNRHRVTSEESP